MSGSSTDRLGRQGQGELSRQSRVGMGGQFYTEKIHWCLRGWTRVHALCMCLSTWACQGIRRSPRP